MLRKILVIVCLLNSLVFALSDVKQEAIALYTTKNYDASFEKFASLPSSQKDETVFLLMSNILSEKGKENQAIQYLNKALDKDPTFYKAYYNLGCIFAKKKLYKNIISNGSCFFLTKQCNNCGVVFFLFISI